jgi:hypothetical protein
MTFAGKARGPCESEILQSLGASHFGCTPAGLEDGISFARFSEMRSELVPVHVDEHGKAYVEYSPLMPGRTQRLYLEEQGFGLDGHIQTFTEDECVRRIVRPPVEER